MPAVVNHMSIMAGTSPRRRTAASLWQATSPATQYSLADVRGLQNGRNSVGNEPGALRRDQAPWDPYPRDCCQPSEACPLHDLTAGNWLGFSSPVWESPAAERKRSVGGHCGYGAQHETGSVSVPSSCSAEGSECPAVPALLRVPR